MRRSKKEVAGLAWWLWAILGLYFLMLAVILALVAVNLGIIQDVNEHVPGHPERHPPKPRPFVCECEAKVCPPEPPCPSCLPQSGADAPFDHVIFLMMENRAFDHLLGWLPGADGRQEGLCFTDQLGVSYPTYNLAPDFQGCGYFCPVQKDECPSHVWQDAVVEVNNGAMDGWLKTPAGRGPNNTFPIGYYDETASPTIAALARSYTTLDRYFCSFLGETFPNRFYAHSAQTPMDQNLILFNNTIPTIWDQIKAANLTGFYYQNGGGGTGGHPLLPFLLLWGDKYLNIIKDVETDFLGAAASGNLPNLAFVDPNFFDENTGTSGDDHAPSDIRTGDAFISRIYQAVRNSPAWSRTVLIVTFDESGGFFDHIPPPQVVDHTNPDDVNHSGNPTSAVPNYKQLGPRVPAIVISPWSKAQVFKEGPYEHASMLRMVEWRWGLPPLTWRDANARNLAETLDFSQFRHDLPDIPVFSPFPSAACGPTSTPAKPPPSIPGGCPRRG